MPGARSAASELTCTVCTTLSAPQQVEVVRYLGHFMRLRDARPVMYRQVGGCRAGGRRAFRGGSAFEAVAPVRPCRAVCCPPRRRRRAGRQPTVVLPGLAAASLPLPQVMELRAGGQWDLLREHVHSVLPPP